MATMATGVPGLASLRNPGLVVKPLAYQTYVHFLISFPVTTTMQRMRAIHPGIGSFIRQDRWTLSSFILGEGPTIQGPQLFQPSLLKPRPFQPLTSTVLQA